MAKGAVCSSLLYTQSNRQAIHAISGLSQAIINFNFLTQAGRSQAGPSFLLIFILSKIRMADLTTPSVWSGSEYTKKLVKNVIAQRWGESEAEQYDPQTNCFTFKGWLNKGYTVKKGEKAIRSIIQTEENESTETGKPANKPTILPVFLFYYKQVTKLAS